MRMNYLNIIVFGLIMNTLIAVVIFDGPNSPWEDTKEKIGEQSGIGEESLSGIDNADNSQAAGSSGNQNEQTWGSAIGMFGGAWDIIRTAFWPLSWEASPDESRLEEIIRTAFSVFRMIYSLLMILAVYNIVKQ